MAQGDNVKHKGLGGRPYVGMREGQLHVDVLTGQLHVDVNTEN